MAIKSLMAAGEHLDDVETEDEDVVHDAVMDYMQRPQVYDTVPSAAALHDWVDSATTMLVENGEALLPNGTRLWFQE